MRNFVWRVVFIMIFFAITLGLRKVVVFSSNMEAQRTEWVSLETPVKAGDVIVSECRLIKGSLLSHTYYGKGDVGLVREVYSTPLPWKMPTSPMVSPDCKPGDKIINMTIENGR